MSPTISNETLDALRANFSGELIAPGDERYDAARKVWNGDIDRRPALVARCQGATDVAAAVRFARDHDLAATVRGGGHAVAGYAVADDALLIDLSAMVGVRVDPMAQTVRAQGGCLNAHLDRETQAFGLAATTGFVSHTGIGGLTLGGGIGYLMRKFGLTIDSLVSCDVVTADGEQIVASESENADLFWGLRGGGGNFGIVTSFEFQLHPLGPEILAGLVLWELENAPEVLGFLRDFAADAPDEVGVTGNVRLAPAMPAIPEQFHGQPVVGIILNYSGPMAEAEEALRPVREFGSPIVDAVMPKPYVAHQKMLDPAVPHGNHYYWKSHKLGALTDEVIGIVADHASRITSPLSTVPIFTFGGAVARVPDDATAFPNRQAMHDINIVASWLPEQAGEADRHKEWVRGFFGALEPHSQGVYVNFTSDTSDRVATGAYSAEQWARLTALKAKFDPTNFFNGNANIPPTG